MGKDRATKIESAIHGKGSFYHKKKMILLWLQHFKWFVCLDAGVQAQLALSTYHLHIAWSPNLDIHLTWIPIFGFFSEL